MASAQSLRCLVRPTRPIAAPRIPSSFATTSTAVAAFSTTSAASAVNPPAIKSRSSLSGPAKKNYKKGVAAPVNVKKPGPGERKAFRKRIQLSNNSALPVSGLAVLEAGTMLREDMAGQVVGIPNDVVDQLRTLQAFKPTQSWGLFRQPHMLVRRKTVEVMNRLREASDKKTALKMVLTGSRLSGKSVMLLKTMSYALQNGWVAIHIPEGQDLTNGHTEYSPIPDTEPMQFAQPVYTLKLLQNILKANQKVLASLKTEKDWSRLANVNKGDTLADLVASCKESEYAWPTLEALWTELTLPGRPPVLFTLDGLSHVNKLSEYRDPSFNQVHAHDLTLIGMFFDALSGKKALPNGGAIIAATSESNNSPHPSQNLVLAQLEAGQAGQPIPQPDAYGRHDNRIYDGLKNSRVVRLEGVSKKEARALMEYWGASGMVKGVVDHRTVSEKWTLAGHGLVGEMERAALLTLKL
ncbi:mitochondrial ribosomal death-associated protein 3-domain-containing protein [Stachybotrys elegans]|uniref:Small ribosomal subunit protein mS29 n=1 Tax=Stachybotrys elegans TaxID=80388 RepID=A0A8K0T7U3_9HYPO|nr:mitochondrial ribosomal death-associated protein 3-domain-containing protein [Stachybotrys elegans]